MPQRSRSRLGILSGYANRRIAKRSEWRRSMCARTRRTIADFPPKGRNSLARLPALGFLRRCRHRQVNATFLAVTAFVQSSDDFFNGPLHGLYVSLLIATNRVIALLDDVAMPIRAVHVRGRLCRLYRYDFVVFSDQRTVTLCKSENGGYGRGWPLSSISG